MWQVSYRAASGKHYLVAYVYVEWEARDLRRELIFYSLQENLGWTICLQKVSLLPWNLMVAYTGFTI